jgi:hypothetical protein
VSGSVLVCYVGARLGTIGYVVDCATCLFFVCFWGTGVYRVSMLLCERLGFVLFSTSRSRKGVCLGQDEGGLVHHVPLNYVCSMIGYVM